MSDRARQPVPVVVNRTLAQAFFAESDPVGQHLLMGREQEVILEVVGVAADTKMRTLGEAGIPAFFKPDFNSQLLVRVTGNPSQWIEPLRTALGEADRTAALDVRRLSEAAAGALFPMRVATGFLVSLSGLGLALSLIGLYGAVSNAVGRRTRELGIRAALGASRSRIVSAALRGPRNRHACVWCGRRHSSSDPGNSALDRFASGRYRSLGARSFPRCPFSFAWDWCCSRLDSGPAHRRH